MGRSSLIATALAVTAGAASIPSSITNQAQLTSAVNSLSGLTGNEYFSGFAAIYNAIKPSAAPTSTSAVAAQVASAYAAYPSNPNAVGANLLLNGVAGSALQPTVSDSCCVAPDVIICVGESDDVSNANLNRVCPGTQPVA